MSGKAGLNIAEAHFVDAEAEAEAAPHIPNWLSFMRRRGVKPTQSDWDQGSVLPAGEYVGDGEGWREVTP